MKRIKLIPKQSALVDDQDFEYLNQWRWRLIKDRKNSFYAGRTDPYIRRTIFMHRVILNTPKNMLTDHINGNGLDNRRKNLRICTHAQNCRNRKSMNKNGYKGIEWMPKINKYRARIRIDNKNVHLGVFKNIKNAAKAYDKKAKEIFGEFAYLNF